MPQPKLKPLLLCLQMGPRQGPPSLDDRLLSIQEADDQEGTGETDDRVTGASKAEKPVIRVWNTFDSVNLGILRRRTDSGGGPPTMQRSLSFSEEQDGEVARNGTPGGDEWNRGGAEGRPLCQHEIAACRGAKGL